MKNVSQSKLTGCSGSRTALKLTTILKSEKVGLSELHGLTLRACMGLLPYFVRRPKKLKPKRVYKITKPKEKAKKSRKSYVRKNSETDLRKINY